MIHQIRVEGSRQDAAGGVAHGLGGLVGVVRQGGETPGTGLVGLGQAGGTVVIQGLHLVDGSDLPGAAHARGDDLSDLLPGQLIQQRVPPGIVVGDLVAVLVHPELDQAQRPAIFRGDLSEGGIFPIVRGQLGLALPAIHVLVVLELLAPVQHRVVVPVFGGCALPVGAAHVGDSIVSPVLILVPVGVFKLVGDVIASRLGLGVGLLVQAQGDLVGHQGSLAFRVHAAVGRGGREALLCQNVVHGVVGVPGSGEIIVAVHQHIGLRVFTVVGGKLPLLHGDGHRLALAGGQELRLGEAHQLHAGCLHAVLPVVFAVGLLEVDLDNLLAGGGAVVGDLDAHLIHGVRAGAGLLHAVVGVGKVRVALTETEGIADRGFVAEIAGLGRTHHVVFIAALGVAIAQVDALLIDHVVAVLLQRAVVVQRSRRALVGRGAEIGQGRVLAVIRPEGGGETAGGIHLAGEDVADRVHAHLAGGADPEGGVHAVLGIVQESRLHLIGEVQDHHDLLDGAGILLGLQAPEQILLHGAKLQIVAAHGVALAAIGVIQLADGVAAARHVTALAAQTGDEHQRRVAILGEGRTIGGLNSAPRGVTDGLRAGHAGAGGAGGALVTGLLFGGIPVPEGLIDLEIAVALKGGFPVRRGGNVHVAAAGSAVNGIHGRDGEEAQAAARAQGQGVVFVFEKHHALGHGLLRRLAPGGHQAVQAGVGGLEVLGVLLAYLLGHLPEGGRLQEAGDLRRILVGDDAAGNQRGEEAGQHRHGHLQPLGLHRQRLAGCDQVHHQAGGHQPHHDEERRVPGGVDAHHCGADIGIEGVDRQLEGDHVRQRHHISAETRLLYQENERGAGHRSGSESPHGRPGHAVHAAGGEAVQRRVCDARQCGQDQPDDRELV